MARILEYRDGKIWDARKGRFVGTLTKEGYVVLSIDCRLVKAHRWIWEYLNGPIPEGMTIDHINGVRSDNRIENLRLASNAQNIRNSGLSSRNASGLKGVSWEKVAGRWQVKIRLNGKLLHVGTFECKFLAANAYDLAAEYYFGEYARTNAYD